MGCTVDKLPRTDKLLQINSNFTLPPVDTVIPRAILCRRADVTFPVLSFSAYRRTLVIRRFTKRCTANCFLIDWCTFVNRWLKNQVGQWWGISRAQFEMLGFSVWSENECIAVFHLAISNMAQRHVAFCKRHVALYGRHAALHERHVALLIFRR